MGTYYGLGIIENFSAYSERDISKENWTQILDEQIDLSLFDLTLSDRKIAGVLKDKIFENNIGDFYAKLKKITHDDQVTEFFESNGNKVDDYSFDRTEMHISSDHFGEIVVDYSYRLLFFEGKVLAETFSVEPKLMSYLFRHSNFGNCLAGCVISTIFG